MTWNKYSSHEMSNQYCNLFPTKLPYPSAMLGLESGPLWIFLMVLLALISRLFWPKSCEVVGKERQASSWCSAILDGVSVRSLIQKEATAATAALIKSKWHRSQHAHLSAPSLECTALTQAFIIKKELYKRKVGNFVNWSVPNKYFQQNGMSLSSWENRNL